MRPTASTANLHPAHPARLREELAPPTDDENSRVVARPDGYYWVADDGHQEFGPFVSAMDALVALRSGIETGLEPDVSLSEIEAEIHYTEPKLNDEGVPEE
ncbi:MAG TPA: hypothetical protein VFX81_07760 [Burkholderiaceae bacterium]|nr:hypothetical protein [Burkholderiaceae bacterium]